MPQFIFCEGQGLSLKTKEKDKDVTFGCVFLQLCCFWPTLKPREGTGLKRAPVPDFFTQWSVLRYTFLVVHWHVQTLQDESNDGALAWWLGKNKLRCLWNSGCTVWSSADKLCTPLECDRDRACGRSVPWFRVGCCAASGWSCLFGSL